MKPVESFPRNAARADGRGIYCRQCKRESDRELNSPLAKKERLEKKARKAGREFPSASKATPGRKEEAPRAPGRPRGAGAKLSQEVIEAVCQGLARGHTRRASAAHAGIPDRTLRRWLSQATEEGATPLELELLEEVELAEGQGEYFLGEVVRDSVDIDPNSAKWMLERRFAEGWARRESLALTGDEKPVDLVALRESIAQKVKGLVAARVQRVPDMPAPAPAPEAPAEEPEE